VGGPHVNDAFVRRRGPRDATRPSLRTYSPARTSAVARDGAACCCSSASRCSNGCVVGAATPDEARRSVRRPSAAGVYRDDQVHSFEVLDEDAFPEDFSASRPGWAGLLRVWHRRNALDGQCASHDGGTPDDGVQDVASRSSRKGSRCRQ